VTVDQFSMTYMSWGDTDGAGNNVSAGGVSWYENSTTGYIGLDNLVVGGPISITGTVRIDIGTATTGVYAAAAAAHGSTTQTTVVHISFADNFSFNVTGPITANVMLDSAADLNSAGAHTLGNIYISSFGVSIANGSWVDIWAH